MRVYIVCLIIAAFVAAVVIPVGIATRPNGVWFFGRNKP